MQNLTEAYHIEYGGSTPNCPQGNGQAKATNKETVQAAVTVRVLLANNEKVLQRAS